MHSHIANIVFSTESYYILLYSRVSKCNAEYSIATKQKPSVQGGTDSLQKR